METSNNNGQLETIKRFDVNDDRDVGADIHTFLHSTSNTFLLMVKCHFKGSSFYLGNILIPILIVTGVSAFMPMINGLMWVMFLGMTFSGLATYGTIFFTIRKSTIVKNIDLTSTQSASIYLSIFVLIGLSLFITFNIILGWSMLLDIEEISFAMHSMQVVDESDPANWESVWYLDWGLIMGSGGLWYYMIEQIFLCFSLSFFVEKIVNTQKNFFIFVFIYILAGIFFSGMFSSTMYIDKAGEVGVIDISDPSYTEELQGVMILEPYTWGQPLWWIGQFFPHFGANQLAINIGQQAAHHNPDMYDTLPDGWYMYNRWADVSILNAASANSKTLYYALAPWGWVLGLLVSSGLMETYKK